nr:helix-turn-helix transcriptional regulator [Lachnospiraceae bacterium]
IYVETTHHTLRISQETYISEHIRDIDTSTMTGRIRYHRIRQGISKVEMGKRIGMTDPSSYAKTYEKASGLLTDFKQVRKVCQALGVSEKEIFDDYMSFLASDYITRLLEVQAILGETNAGMDRRIGMSKGQYKKWIDGNSVPGREAVEKIMVVFEEMGKTGS